MYDRFIKLICSPEADFLQQNYPNAFLLLVQIAKTARRTQNCLDGLEIGDSIVGEIETSRKAGISKKEYRNALEKLENLGFIETVFNPKNKKHQKRAIKGAIKSKIVNLINSSICDINPEVMGDQKGNQRAIKGRSMGDKQERTRTNKKEQEQIQEQAIGIGLDSVILDFEEERQRLSNLLERSNSSVETPKSTSDNICSQLENEQKKYKTVDFSQENKLTSSLEELNEIKDVDLITKGMGLSPEERQSLYKQKFSPERLKLAVEYAKTAKIKKDNISTLMWHCQQEVPPLSSFQIKIRDKEFLKINDQTASDFYNQCRTLLKRKDIFYESDHKSKFLKIGTKEKNEAISIYERPEIFKQLVESALRKYGLWVAIEEQIEALI